MAAAQAGETNFHIETDLPLFLESVQRGEQFLIEDASDFDKLQLYATVLDQTTRLIRSIHEVADPDDKEDWNELAGAFSEISRHFHHHFLSLSRRVTSLALHSANTICSGSVGRPSLDISSEMLENLLGLGFTCSKASRIFGVSRWTIYRRIQQFGLQSTRKFSSIPDSDLDNLVQSYTSRHGTTTGQTYMQGYLRSQGVHVQRHRVRESLSRVDPNNTALRWGIVITRRQYYVPWPNSLWHLDGHHSLIRWGFVVHGCIDGYSRRIMYLHCSTNNYSETVLDLFTKAIEEDGNLWPSRIRVDRGVENVLVCEAMVEARGENRGSFIPGPSTRNQRIERLWREVFRCDLHFFYYVFYAMEDTGLLNLENPAHLFILHLIFLPRINHALQEFKEAFNHHSMRTSSNWSPYQMWLNGMLREDNPLSHDMMDEDPDDLDIYGDDPNGPSPFEDSDNNVIVHPVHIDDDAAISAAILEVLSPLGNSNQMGIDMFREALSLYHTIVEQTANDTTD